MEALSFGTGIPLGGEVGGEFTPVFGTMFFDSGAEGFVLRRECVFCVCVCGEK